MAENSRKKVHFQLSSIAIIAILAAMLLPALQGARNRAKDSSCKANLKQLQLAHIQYTDSNDGWMMRMYRSASWGYSWYINLGNIMGKWGADVTANTLDALVEDGKTSRESLQVFMCPGEVLPGAVNYTKYGGFNGSQYMLNTPIAGTFSGFGDYYDREFGSMVAAKRITGIRAPSKAIGLFDSGSMGNAHAYGLYINSNNSAEVEKRLATRHGGGVIDGGVGSEYHWYYGNGSMNMSYLDGHVDSAKKNDFIYKDKYSTARFWEGVDEIGILSK